MNVTQVMQLDHPPCGVPPSSSPIRGPKRNGRCRSPRNLQRHRAACLARRPARPPLPRGTPGPGRPIIINLPTTVENATPNVFADQIEWMDRHLSPREHIVLSVHTHNDRGTGVAAAELAVMAGAQRVEGCLFGNGERCGNVDIVTMALNLYTQGVHPQLDFSNITGVARWPKNAQASPSTRATRTRATWCSPRSRARTRTRSRRALPRKTRMRCGKCPTCPSTRRDLGRTYDSVIRVNSQSGKGGIAFLLEREHGVVMPPRCKWSSAPWCSATPTRAKPRWAPRNCGNCSRPPTCAPPPHPPWCATATGWTKTARALDVTVQGVRQTLRGQGNGPIAATVDALGLPLRVDHYEERATGSGANAQALAIVEAAMEGVNGATLARA